MFGIAHAIVARSTPIRARLTGEPFEDSGITREPPSTAGNTALAQHLGFALTREAEQKPLLRITGRTSGIVSCGRAEEQTSLGRVFNVGTKIKRPLKGQTVSGRATRIGGIKHPARGRRPPYPLSIDAPLPCASEARAAEEFELHLLDQHIAREIEAPGRYLTPPRGKPAQDPPLICVTARRTRGARRPTSTGGPRRWPSRRKAWPPSTRVCIVGDNYRGYAALAGFTLDSWVPAAHPIRCWTAFHPSNISTRSMRRCR